jgi:nitric oxide reductase activation protein
VLADLSLSTDAWVSDEQRVIDVIRDSLMLFGEALTAQATPALRFPNRRSWCAPESRFRRTPNAPPPASRR